MSSKIVLRPGNNGLPPLPTEERWADAHHKKITISDSSNLQNEKHMEMGALKNAFGHSGCTVFASNITGVIAPLLCGV